jgi:type VI protein secretion system component Hcp
VTLVLFDDVNRIERFSMTLGKSTVTSFESSQGTSSPTAEIVKFNFARIDIRYRRLNSDGTLGATVNAGWDLARNSSR